MTFARIMTGCCRAAANDKIIAPDEATALAERYAARAVYWLAKAKQAGQFNAPDRMRKLRVDSDFAQLQSSEDFRQAFP